MAQKATRDQKEQVITLSQIDALVTILGDYPEATLPLSMNVNPFGFLLDICKSLGIFDELLLFLVKLIQYELPLIELAVKGILLSNLKELISCSSDPFIPKYMRKKISDTDISSGITFSLTDIDFSNLLSINPLGQGAEYSYLGIPRSYVASFKIIQKRENKIVLSKISGQYKDDYVKAKDKLNQWINKYDKTYGIIVDNEGKAQCTNPKYSIVERGIEEGVYSKKTDKEKKKKTAISSGKTFCARYIIEESVDPPENGNCYASETKSFETYQEADSFINTRRNKYIKYYNILTRKPKEDYDEKASITAEVYITPHELARAQDFNAFLWYVCHMANFNDPIKLPLLEGYPVTKQQTLDGKDVWKITKENSLNTLNDYLKNKFNVAYASDTKENEKEGPLGVFKVKEITNNGKVNKDITPSGLLGSVLNVHDTQDSTLYDLCIKVDYGITQEGEAKENQDDYTVKTYTIVPATSDNISLNWYGDRGKYFDFLKYWASPKKERQNSPRNYSKEIGICNIEFDTTINDTSQNTFFHRNKLKFTILPKPLVHIPQWLTSGEWPWSFKMILFDMHGKYSTKGKYSCFVVHENTVNGFEPICIEQQDATLKKTHPCYYKLANKSNEPQGLYLHIPKHWKDGNSNESNLRVSTSPTNIDDITEENAIPPSCLYECYPNLTIYEFNYDYVMSQRLFDPKVIAGELIQSLLNCRLGGSGNLNVGIKHNITEGTARLVEVIKNMITADTYSSDDCYFQFSNQQYDNMARKTENKKAQGFHLEGSDRVVNIDTNRITQILNEYDNPDITQAGQVDVLNRAFTESIASITAETEDTETWDIKFNIIQQLIEDLTFEIIKSILTPKIIMLLMVNKQLMGNTLQWNGDALTNLEQILISIVTNIVKEIKDMLLSELLEFLLGFLKPKFAELAALIVKEYLEQYRNQIEALIKACGFGWGKQATADTKLDQVDYADIDPVQEVTKDNQC